MKGIVTGFVVLALVAAGGWLFWQWGFCRFSVGPDEMAVVTAKIGTPLPQGQMLAKKGQQGIQEDVLGEGRHFLNPWLYDRHIRPVVLVPPGKVGIVTSKVGENLPEGEFLAGPGQKGVWRNVLGPGKYRMNPHGYEIDVVDAISIPIGYAGVLTSLSGAQPAGGGFAGDGQKGVRRDVLQPGLYYVNSKELKVDVLEIGVNQVSLLGRGGGQVLTKGQIETGNVAMQELQRNVIAEQKKKRFDYVQKSADFLSVAPSRAQRSAANAPVRQEAAQQADIEQARQQYLQNESNTLELSQFVEFPSRDGFRINLDMTVEFELPPDKIAAIFSRYGDLPAVVDKIILPQISSIARNKGSEYGAKDFVVGEGREKFQRDVTASLQQTLGEKDIVVHNALIRHVDVPMQILDPIQQAAVAIERDLTNKQKQTTAKKQAELNTELSLVQQRSEQVAQETTKLKAEIKADEEKQVAQIHAETLRRTAEIERDTSGIRAEVVRTLAVADAEAVKKVEGEKANGQQLKAAAFREPTAYALFEFARNLSPELRVRVIHAGDGTLWTDLEKARLGDLGGAEIIRKK